MVVRGLGKSIGLEAALMHGSEWVWFRKGTGSDGCVFGVGWFGMKNGELPWFGFGLIEFCEIAGWYG